MRRIVRIVTIVITILVVYCTYQIAVGVLLSSTFAAIFAGVSLIISIYQVISELRPSLQNRRPRESRLIMPGVQREKSTFSGPRARSLEGEIRAFADQAPLLPTQSNSVPCARSLCTGKNSTAQYPGVEDDRASAARAYQCW